MSTKGSGIFGQAKMPKTNHCFLAFPRAPALSATTGLGDCTPTCGGQRADGEGDRCDELRVIIFFTDELKGTVVVVEVWD